MSVTLSFHPQRRMRRKVDCTVGYEKVKVQHVRSIQTQSSMGKDRATCSINRGLYEPVVILQAYELSLECPKRQYAQLICSVIIGTHAQNWVEMPQLVWLQLQVCITSAKLTKCDSEGAKSPSPHALCRTSEGHCSPSAPQTRQLAVDRYL